MGRRILVDKVPNAYLYFALWQVATLGGAAVATAGVVWGITRAVVSMMDRSDTIEV